VHALMGSSAFDLLISHPEVRNTYLNYAAAADLRGPYPDAFTYGGIVFHDYRGADDGTTLTPIDDDEIRFFPVGGRDVFQRVLAPAEFDPFVNQPGQEIYAISIPDRDRGASVRVECYCYPLYICLRPQMLLRGWGTTGV
jgi:hypothetical protein